MVVPKQFMAMILLLVWNSLYPLAATRCHFRSFLYVSLDMLCWALTCIVSPAAIRRCCPIGESAGRALVVNLRVRPALVSFEVLVEVVPSIALMPPTLRLLLVLGGESGLFE